LSLRLFGIPFAKFQQVPSKSQRVIAKNMPFNDKRIAVKQKKPADELKYKNKLLVVPKKTHGDKLRCYKHNETDKDFDIKK